MLLNGSLKNRFRIAQGINRRSNRKYLPNIYYFAYNRVCSKEKLTTLINTK